MNLQINVGRAYISITSDEELTGTLNSRLLGAQRVCREERSTQR